MIESERGKPDGKSRHQIYEELIQRKPNPKIKKPKEENTEEINLIEKEEYLSS